MESSRDSDIAIEEQEAEKAEGTGLKTLSIRSWLALGIIQRQQCASGA